MPTQPASRPWRLLILPVVLLSQAFAAPPAAVPMPEELRNYFKTETERLESACLDGIDSLQAWESRREGYKKELLDMLGLDPLPARTELKPVITGRIEQPDCVVEKLHFQSMPGLYVTANLYLPKVVSPPVPAILYVCGHAQVRTNGISYGNKTAYQHHGIWFARHGYAALVIDTLQLGEIEGLHHGTYREGLWWWNARGYSPAGVEAWNSIRALDYLETRPEIDPKRFGITGRSGGGSYSWTTAAIDDRIKAAAPVAGITDLRNHVIDGCVEGHCDCMFFVNTHRWDYPLNAALIAPRPLLVVNTDSDTIFPLDGVYRTHQKVSRVYKLFGKPDLLGLVIGPGPHKDTQDLQVPVMRWFNQHLKGEDSLVEDAPLKRFEPQALRVFDALPADQINTRIHESFVPMAAKAAGEQVLSQLRTRCFGGWPQRDCELAFRKVAERGASGVRLASYEFTSQSDVTLRLWVAESTRGRQPGTTEVHVLGTNDWSGWISGLGAAFEGDNAKAALPDPVILAGLADELRRSAARRVWLAPRGVGPHPWPTGEDGRSMASAVHAPRADVGRHARLRYQARNPGRARAKRQQLRQHHPHGQRAHGGQHALRRSPGRWRSRTSPSRFAEFASGRSGLPQCSAPPRHCRSPGAREVAVRGERFVSACRDRHASQALEGAAVDSTHSSLSFRSFGYNTGWVGQPGCD